MTSVLLNVYNKILAYPNGILHSSVFLDGEVLHPGTYHIVGAASLAAGTLTLDA